MITQYWMQIVWTVTFNTRAYFESGTPMPHYSLQINYLTDCTVSLLKLNNYKKSKCNIIAHTRLGFILIWVIIF